MMLIRSGQLELPIVLYRVTMSCRFDGIRFDRIGANRTASHRVALEAAHPAFKKASKFEWPFT